MKILKLKLTSDQVREIDDWRPQQKHYLLCEPVTKRNELKVLTLSPRKGLRLMRWWDRNVKRIRRSAMREAVALAAKGRKT